MDKLNSVTLEDIAPKKGTNAFKYLGEVLIFHQFINIYGSKHNTYSCSGAIQDTTTIVEEYGRL